MFQIRLGTLLLGVAGIAFGLAFGRDSGFWFTASASTVSGHRRPFTGLDEASSGADAEGVPPSLPELPLLPCDVIASVGAVASYGNASSPAASQPLR